MAHHHRATLPHLILLQHTPLSHHTDQFMPDQLKATHTHRRRHQFRAQQICCSVALHKSLRFLAHRFLTHRLQHISKLMILLEKRYNNFGYVISSEHLQHLMHRARATPRPHRATQPHRPLRATQPQRPPRAIQLLQLPRATEKMKPKVR